MIRALLLDYNGGYVGRVSISNMVSHQPPSIIDYVGRLFLYDRADSTLEHTYREVISTVYVRQLDS